MHCSNILWDNQKRALSSTSSGRDASAEDSDSDSEDDEVPSLERELEEAARERGSKEDGLGIEEGTVGDLLRDIEGTKKPSIRIDSSSLSTSSQSLELALALPATKKPILNIPSKVVKRTTRIMKDDGTEAIEIGVIYIYFHLQPLKIIVLLCSL